MMTVHKLSCGDGYRYYTHEVASGDALRSNNRELGDYYTVVGMPPGQWIGSSVHELGVSGNVTEAQMHALFGGTQKPLSAQQLLESFQSAQEIYTAAYASEHAALIRSAAEEAHFILSHRSTPGAEGTLKAIATALGVDHKTVHNRLKEYENAGYDVSTFNAKISLEEFTATYKMTNHRERMVHRSAQSHAENTRDSWLKEHGMNISSKSYNLPETTFTDAVQERINRHERTTGNTPTPQQKRAFRLEIGAQYFYAEHKYRPENEELIRFIQRLEKPAQQSVAGYDLVFSPTKSVSIAWGLGNESLRKGIEKAHEKAIADAVKYLEDNALYTRRGQGGIEQIDVDGGIIATKFRHYDSREGDPNLHDHLVIANRVKGSDGQWSTIDGRMIYGHGVTASELYNTRIAQYIHQDLGLEFVGEERKGKQIFELAGISKEAIKTFSSRRIEISKEYEKVRKEFIAEHGYEPNQKQEQKLYQQVTLATRPQKSEAKSLQELNQQWREKAEILKDFHLPTGDELEAHLRASATQQAPEVIEGISQALVIPDQEHAQNIIRILEESRATWSARHIEAEAHRYFRKITHGAFVDQKVMADTLVAVKEQSVEMTVKEKRPLPEQKIRRDGTSVYTRAGSQLFTSKNIIHAEQEILEAAFAQSFSPASKTTFAEQLEQHKNNHQISPAQENMARVFSTSNKQLVIGIGPAGAGKTTSTKLTVKTVQAQGRKIIGLAPTAAAASVMSEELGIQATTLDRFLLKPETLSPGDVLLVDEIGMVSTPKLHQLVQHSNRTGAVIRGMGDTRQLSAVGAGGTLRLIEREAGAVYLEDIFRFRNADGSTNIEEANASLALREPALTGADKPFDWYLKNERITAGRQEKMLTQVFDAWIADTAEGKSSLMLATNNEMVKELNQRAQIHAILTGEVKDQGASVIGRDQLPTYVGDIIVTRQNNRTLTTRAGKDFVKNGDQWKILKVHSDGSLLVKNTKHQGKVTLPAAYVRENVELGYAATTHRAQGATVDTVHALVDSSTDRAGAYVGLTRGKSNNHLYVVTDEETSRDDVLDSITQNYDRNLSVHEEIERLRTQDRDLATRMKVYESLAEHSMTESFKTMVRNTLEPELASSVVSAEGFGALAHELDTVYRAGLDPKSVLERAASWREIDSAEDAAAVLQWRVKATVEHHRAVVAKRDARPLGNYSDETLAKMLDRAEAALPSKIDDTQLEDSRWASRPYALVKTEKLQEMRTRTFTLLRAKEDSKDPYIAELKENAYAMDAEWIRRAHMSKDQKAVEQFVRGEKRRDHLFTLASAIRSEVWLRKSSLPLVDEAKYVQKPGEKITGGISEYSVDSFWATNPLVKPENKTILAAHRKEIGQLSQLRGQQIASNPPQWAKELGAVPAYAPAAKRWYRVAAEVEAYRNYYQIPSGEESAIPKKYRESEQGQYLQSQITAVHKGSRLSSTWTAPEQVADIAATSEEKLHDKEAPSEAEQLVREQKKDAQLNHIEQQMAELTEERETLAAQIEQLNQQIQVLQQKLPKEEASLQEQKMNLSQLMRGLNSQIEQDENKIRVAQKNYESSGLFGKSKAKAELRSAQEEFATSYGGAQSLIEAQDKWVKVQPSVQRAQDYLEAQKQVVQKLEEDMAAKKQTMEALSQKSEKLSARMRRLRVDKARLSVSEQKRRDRLANAAKAQASKSASTPAVSHRQDRVL